MAASHCLRDFLTTLVCKKNISVTGLSFKSIIKNSNLYDSSPQKIVPLSPICHSVTSSTTLISPTTFQLRTKYFTRHHITPTHNSSLQSSYVSFDCLAFHFSETKYLGIQDYPFVIRIRRVSS